ncbi:transposase [Thalassotalea ponticola]|uniref:transposase n=1 Tax=Thalassotalea ponticola TaxID=1523392 RepID=UPI0025B5942D|nr:transposase [Thalassotalea ponticola]MDN3653602.1 transposase [Thalassotalea ponticola]
MVKYKYSSEKIFEVLSELEEAGGGNSEFYRKHNVNSTTVYEWRKKFAQLSVESIKHLRRVEAENIKLLNECEKLISQRNAAVEFIKNQYPSDKERCAFASELVKKGIIGPTDVCDLFTIKLNGFRYEPKKR